jgi:pimeloyl-ACP methyl ester carboxylesterase
VPNPDFDRLYERVPAEQKELLRGFRADHAYRELDTGAGRWRYLACGDGREALLLMPGAFLAAHMWFHVILALEERYRIIVPDSYALQGTFEMDDVCQSLLRILDAEGIGRVTFTGLSAGGGVAQYFLQEHPDRVAHLVLSHCGVLKPDAEAETQIKRLQALVRVLPMWLVRRFVLKRTAGRLPPTSGWIEFHNAYFREAGSYLTKAILIGFLQGGAEVRRHFVSKPEALDSWTGETLILGSRDDHVAAQSLEELKIRFPRARTHVLAEGGHHAFMLFPEVYTGALCAFLEDVHSETVGTGRDTSSGGMDGQIHG